MPFNPTPFKIKTIKGTTMVTATSKDKDITRNISFFKKITGDATKENPNEDDSEDTSVECSENQEQSSLPRPMELRRSERAKTQPKYLNDFVL